MIVDVEVRRAGNKGQGVYALRTFRVGEFIFRRRHARVVRNAQVPRLSRQDQRHPCEVDFERSAVLVGPGAYLDHSCDPNAMRSGVKVFAWRDIPRGTEITIDYRLNAFTGERTRCLCQSRNCTGTLANSFFALTPRRQQAYLPYAPVFVQSEYARRKRLSRTQRRSRRALAR